MTLLWSIAGAKHYATSDSRNCSCSLANAMPQVLPATAAAGRQTLREQVAPAIAAAGRQTLGNSFDSSNYSCRPPDNSEQVIPAIAAAGRQTLGNK